MRKLILQSLQKVGKNLKKNKFSDDSRKLAGLVTWHGVVGIFVSDMGTSGDRKSTVADSRQLCMSDDRLNWLFYHLCVCASLFIMWCVGWLRPVDSCDSVTCSTEHSGRPLFATA